MRSLLVQAWFLGAGLLAGAAVWAQAPQTVELRTDHVDLRIEYAGSGEGAPLQLVVRDEDAALSLAPTNAVLVVAESARLELPGDFPPLGSAGESLWILPQSQDPDLLYLGLSAEGLPPLLGSSVSVELVRVEGPGAFLMWQSDAFGGLDVRMNSRDGVDAQDHVELVSGGHSHFNFGFTSNGVYHVWMRAVGRRTGETTNVVSDPTPFRFQVEPVPEPPASAFALWQAAHWPGSSGAAASAPAADPDGDGRSNVQEYAEGTDPTVKDAPVAAAPPLAVALDGTQAATVLRVSAVTVASATDLVPVLVRSAAPGGPWVRLDPAPAVVRETLESVPVRTRWVWSLGVFENAPATFFRLEYVLGTEP